MRALAVRPVVGKRTNPTVVTLDTMTFATKGREGQVFREAQILIRLLLETIAPEGGEYLVRVSRKTRWQGHTKQQYRLGTIQQGWLCLTVKPQGYDNGCVFEYLIRGQNGTFWEATEMHNRIRKYLDLLAEEATVPAVATEAPTPTPDTIPMPNAAASTAPAQLPMSMSAKVARLEELARRSTTRQAELDALACRREEMQVKLNTLKAEIEKIEAQELALMQAADTDTECLEAQQALAALQKLFGGL